jgi:fatty acid desaturase
LFWFNNGYHQEHHWDPKMHWTQMKQLHQEIAPQLAANHTRILRGPHITALLEDWLREHGQDTPQQTGGTMRGRPAA